MLDKSYKKISLTWGVHQYEVKTITNSTEFKPGQWLNVDVVQRLCEAPDWDVSIADNQLWTILLGQLGRIPTPSLPL